MDGDHMTPKRILVDWHLQKVMLSPSFLGLKKIFNLSQYNKKHVVQC